MADTAREEIDNKSFKKAYPLQKRIIYTLCAVGGAVTVAGFWNYHLVDGFGKEVIAGNIIGDPTGLGGDFSTRGNGFGFLFAAVAGIAATFTACNCVVFAMIPGLACSVDNNNHKPSVWKAFRTFLYGVLAVTAFYGFLIGLMGKEGVELMNERAVRLAQAQVVFTLLGSIMLVWGAFEMGYLEALAMKFSEPARAFFAQPTVKAGLLGVLVGFFAVGRPFPVFREFLLYAASASNPFYGAGVMMVQGIGQVAVMALIFILIVKLAGDKIGRAAATRPYKFQLISAMALISGGMYFVYYWGLAFVFNIGRWGFKLGLY